MPDKSAVGRSQHVEPDEFTTERQLRLQLHLRQHRHKACEKKPESERTFSRVDHLFQHIRRVYFRGFDLQDFRSARFSQWFRDADPLPPSSLALRCGFCGKSLDTWEERVEHLAVHFKAGVDDSMWWLSRKYNLIDDLPGRVQDPDS